MDSAVKWRLNRGASWWLVGGVKEESAFVYKEKSVFRFIPAILALKLLTLYQQYLRPSIPAGCRFEPGCSEYVKQAILKYGFIKGVFKGLIRISRCHPFSGKAGYDPLI